MGKFDFWDNKSLRSPPTHYPVQSFRVRLFLRLFNWTSLVKRLRLFISYFNSTICIPSGNWDCSTHHGPTVYFRVPIPLSFWKASRTLCNPASHFSRLEGIHTSSQYKWGIHEIILGHNILRRTILTLEAIISTHLRRDRVAEMSEALIHLQMQVDRAILLTQGQHRILRRRIGPMAIHHRLLM